MTFPEGSSVFLVPIILTFDGQQMDKSLICVKTHTLYQSIIVSLMTGHWQKEILG